MEKERDEVQEDLQRRLDELARELWETNEPMDDEISELLEENIHKLYA